jgi:hypothetical protein
LPCEAFPKTKKDEEKASIADAGDGENSMKAELRVSIDEVIIIYALPPSIFTRRGWQLLIFFLEEA